MSFDELVPKNSKYLAKEDVGDDGVIITVRGFKKETLKSDKGDEEKVILYFMEEEYKPMVLGNTTSTQLGKATGALTAGEARGKKIVVFNDESVMFGSKNTGGLRIKKYSTAQPATPKASKDPFADFKDDIPGFD